MVLHRTMLVVRWITGLLRIMMMVGMFLSMHRKQHLTGIPRERATLQSEQNAQRHKQFEKHSHQRGGRSFDFPKNQAKSPDPEFIPHQSWRLHWREFNRRFTRMEEVDHGKSEKWKACDAMRSRISGWVDFIPSESPSICAHLRFISSVSKAMHPECRNPASPTLFSSFSHLSTSHISHP